MSHINIIIKFLYVHHLPMTTACFNTYSLWNVFPEDGYSQQLKHVRVTILYTLTGAICNKQVCVRQMSACLDSATGFIETRLY